MIDWKLKALLRLKRYELPSPGYFKAFAENWTKWREAEDLRVREEESSYSVLDNKRRQRDKEI